MHFPVEGTRKTLLFFTILTSWVIGFGVGAGDKTLNLRIGFDLTQGTNGAPALRIRDFEDSEKSEYEKHPRAEEKMDEKVSPSIRADSFSDDDGKAARDDSSRGEPADSSDDFDEDDVSGGKRHSTKGLKPAEYEPEDNPRIHGRYQDDDEDSDGGEGRRHRNKRDVDHEIQKRKSKKFHSARKQGVTRA